MKDIWNPTKEEIIEWAYSNDPAPEQDWELAVYELDNIELIIGFLCDRACPKHEFFLGCLYVFIGDYIIQEKDDESLAVERILLNASTLTEPDIVDWVSRSNDLIKHPEKYEYKYWGLDSAYVYRWRLEHD